MIAPISTLANMEMALYGGFGSNANAPSYINGYMGGANNYSSYLNPSFYGYQNDYNYGNYNSSFGQSVPYGYGNTNQQNNSVFQGLNSSETKALINDYKKGLAPSEGLLGCVAGNAAFGVAMHPRLIAHPWNSIKTLGDVNKAFADVKVEGSALQKLWKDPKNSDILREAYLQMHKAEARCESKLGAFRRSYKATGDIDRIKGIVDKLKSALKKGDMTAITKHTAELQHAYVSNGPIANAFNKCRNGIAKIIPDSWTLVKGIFTSKETTLAERIEALNKTTKTGFTNILKRGGGVAGGLLFAGLELLMNFGKIKTAFGEDTTTGMKQLGQTTVKGLGNAAGWALGEAAGVWAFTKLGASIGTALGPGVGTVIGGLVGLVGGGLGMWLTGKLTNAIVGQDVADDIEAKKLAQSQEGQIQLLQNTMQRMQKGEKVSPEAQMAVQKLIAQYA